MRKFRHAVAAVFGGSMAWMRGRHTPSEEVGSLPPGVVSVENLENRRMFAVTAQITGNVLFVTGDSNGQAISVYEVDLTPTDAVFVDVNNTGGDLGGFSVANFNSIVFVGDGGNDTLVIGSSQLLTGQHLDEIVVSKPAIIRGGDGDDVIWASDHNDRLYGDGGADTLHAGAGDDVAYGGYGDYGGIDNSVDIIFGDNGADTMYGEEGDDELTGGLGADTMFGEDGNDTFHSQDGAATDYLDGGAGTSDDGTDSDPGDTKVNFP